MVTLSNVKNSLRISHDMDDTLLQEYLNTAENYIIHAVDSRATAAEFEPYMQFDMAVSLLAQAWYMNRAADGILQTPVVVTALIQQLRGRWYANNQ